MIEFMLRTLAGAVYYFVALALTLWSYPDQWNHWVRVAWVVFAVGWGVYHMDRDEVPVVEERRRVVKVCPFEIDGTCPGHCEFESDFPDVC